MPLLREWGLTAADLQWGDTALAAAVREWGTATLREWRTAAFREWGTAGREPGAVERAAAGSEPAASKHAAGGEPAAAGLDPVPAQPAASARRNGHPGADPGLTAPQSRADAQCASAAGPAHARESVVAAATVNEVPLR